MRVLAIILVLTMMPLWMFGCGKSGTGDIQAKLVELMAGDGSLKKAGDDSAGKDYIKALDKEVETISKDFNGVTWANTTLTESNTKTIQHYKNTYKMLVAWSTKGSSFYHDGKLLDKAKVAIEKTSEVYKPSDESVLTAAQRCDSVEYMVRALLILSDAGKIKDDVLEECLGFVDDRFPLAYGDGLNYTRSLYIAFASAVLSGDTDRVANVVESYAPAAYKAVTSGDGLYADGSYLQNEVASTTSYGNQAFSILTEIAYAVSGTSVDFDADTATSVKSFLYDWAKTSVIPSLHNGSALAGTAGSCIINADKMGGAAISSILMLSNFLKDAKGDELKSIIKGYCDSNNNAFATGFTSYGACAYQSVANNDKITAKKVTGVFDFAQMDRLSVLGSKYCASLSLSSTRSVKYETKPIYNPTTLETEGAVNGKGWYTGDGMLLVYTDKYQIEDRYWTYVNAKRIPGTTVDNRDRTPANDGTFDGINSAAGTAVLGNNAISSYMFFNNNGEFLSDLTAKKSYFFFDGKIIALGAGISNTTVDKLSENQSIETIIENVYESGTSVAIANNDYLNMAPGTVYEDQSESIYVLNYGGFYVSKASNSASLNFRLNSTNNGKLNFFEIWLDHGLTPSNATYEYAIVPSSVKIMAKFFDEFVANPEYTVLSNTEKVQAVKDDATGLVGYTFWEAAECNGIKTDFGCNMLVKETDSAMTIALSDYTHNGAGNLTGNTITLNGSYTLKNTPAGVTLNGNVLTIDRAVAANGQTITIELTK